MSSVLAPRRTITVNGQFPGPSLKVKIGSTIRIRVRNNLLNEGLSIHWHGLHMIDNYWMDGDSFVSQCPIPGHSEFTYLVRADNSGTHWWHSHSNAQRLDGLFGPLIIFEKNEIEEKKTSIPLTLGDWFQEDSIMFAATYAWGPNAGPAPSTCYTPFRSYFGGLKLTSMCLDSFIVNGRGQFRNQKGSRFFTV
jgi:FtsP/CotA-like multicopper oxidase with cupredoxin domain